MDENILKLSEALEFSADTEAFNVVDQTEFAKKYLSEGAQNDLSRKSTTMVVRENDSIFKAIYFAVQVGANNIGKGVQTISTAINELSKDGLIHSAFTTMSSSGLVRMFSQIPSVAIFCFVLVPVESYDEIKARYHTFLIEDGESPKPIDDLRMPLADGEFLAEIFMSHNLFSETRIQNQVDQYLSILPKGTRILEINKCYISDLSVLYEVKFFNPLMKTVKSIELQHIRMVEVVDGKLEQFNLLTGIRYLDADRKQLH